MKNFNKSALIKPVVAVLLLLGAGVALGMSSANFAIDQDVVPGGGGAASSGSYQLPGSATGQSSALGSSTSAGYTLVGGYYGAGLNTAPVANTASITVTYNTVYNGTLSATDTDNDSLTYSIVTNGTKGTAVVTDAATGAFTYTPINGQTGGDSFTFKANDGEEDSIQATVTVTISSPNALPTVTLTAPVTGANFAAPANLELTATAADIDGTISKVEFYNGETLLGSDTTLPYSYTWSTVPAGSYTLTAKAYDNLNASKTSTAVIVTVTTYIKPGDCDSTPGVSIAEVQAAINMYLGLMQVTACVDIDNSGNVSIAEVQKVINGYLGL